jgi:hypothetical protein
LQMLVLSGELLQLSVEVVHHLYELGWVGGKVGSMLGGIGSRSVVGHVVIGWRIQR